MKRSIPAPSAPPLPTDGLLRSPFGGQGGILPLGTIIQGDALDVLRGLPDCSVQCVVTSPPYWGLRDYGTGTWDGGDAECGHKPKPRQGNGSSSTVDAKGHHDQPFRDVCGHCAARRIDRQYGLEATPEDHVAVMVAVFREVRRVLRDDGTCWINYGDCYAGSNQTGGTKSLEKGRREDRMFVSPVRVPSGLKPKDLVGMPWRVAFALQSDGWWLRADCIWFKPNPMPESVIDRPTKAHEYVFMLTKAPRYFYDAEAVREKQSNLTIERFPSGSQTRKGGEKRFSAKAGEVRSNGTFSTPMAILPNGRNLRSVWEIATAPYRGAHFATFPEKLVDRCIKAGTSERGACPRCGAPWRREVETSGGTTGTDWRPDKSLVSTNRNYDPRMKGDDYARQTLGWSPGCECGLDPVPCVVLDPFAGAGTTGIVAYRLGREFVGIDLAGGDKDLGGHTAHDRIGAARAGQVLEIYQSEARDEQQTLLGLPAAKP